MTIYLVNLSVEQIEKDYSVTFADADKQWLKNIPSSKRTTYKAISGISSIYHEL